MGGKRFEKGERYTSNYGTVVELLYRIDTFRWMCRVVGSDVECAINQTQLRTGTGFITPVCKTVYGIGYFGKGSYICRHPDGEISDVYCVWANLLKRCYTDYKGNYGKENYKNATVCEEWHNYQTFAKWYEDNTTRFKEHNIVPYLDKDLKIEGNTTYSPDTCILLPNILNCTVRGRVTTTIYQGVTKKNGKYIVSVMFKGKQNRVGKFETLDEAITCYQTEKVKVLRKLADEFKHVLSTEAYDILYNFKKERC